MSPVRRIPASSRFNLPGVLAKGRHTIALRDHTIDIKVYRVLLPQNTVKNSADTRPPLPSSGEWNTGYLRQHPLDVFRHKIKKSLNIAGAELLVRCLDHLRTYSFLSQTHKHSARYYHSPSAC